MDELIDPGCAEYLTEMQRTCGRLHESQLVAVRSVLANIGRCEPNSSSFSLVHGPPGTGKTWMILVLLGALLHHTGIGHIEREKINSLKHHIPSDDIQRCSTNPDGVRILICCASNKGVDNILEKLHRDGLPDGKGGRISPQTVRLARARYDHGGLQMYSIDEKALPFDRYLHNVGETDRRYAPSAARKSFFKECIIVITTLVSSGGARFKNCKLPFDVLVIDEMGQSSEPEALIPLTNAIKRSSKCHIVGVGDPKQLPTVSYAAHQMKSVLRNLWFSYEMQMRSMFERLQFRKRCSPVILTRQYRMCLTIAEINNQIFYGGILESPLPESTFDAPYNKGWNAKTGCFARQTFIDTSLLPNRGEASEEGDGAYMNVEEINIIDELLQRIKDLSGDTFPSLRNQIAVLVPYRAQVEHLRRSVQNFGKYLDKGVSREGYEILFNSVDSMQGSERDIVIFGSTRSNSERKVGFLDNPNRLNVATSRGRKLQIVVGDLSTLGANRYFAKMREYCAKRQNDAVLLQLHHTASAHMLAGLRFY